MKRVYRLYADENSVGYRPTSPGEKSPMTDIVLRKSEVPHGAVVRVFEVLARDPRRALGRHCSAQVQQTAVLIRHEVIPSEPEDVEWTDKQSEEVTEWCDDLAEELQWECRANYADNPWYGSSTFDKWPYVETTVEVDDDDLDGLDEDEIEKKFEEALDSDESCNPTWVVLAPEVARLRAVIAEAADALPLHIEGGYLTPPEADAEAVRQALLAALGGGR